MVVANGVSNDRDASEVGWAVVGKALAMATQRQSLPSVVSSQPIDARSVRAYSQQAVPNPRSRRERREDAGLYNWDELATAQRQAVLAMVHNSRRQRRRARRRALLLTLLLALAVVAVIAWMVLGIGSPATFSL